MRHSKITDVELEKEALKYRTRQAFNKGNRRLYKAAWKRGKLFLDRICSHMLPSKSEPYTLDELQTEANKYRSRGEFQKQSPNVYNVARKRSDFASICLHMEPSKSAPYSIEEMEAEAKKYKTKIDFKNGNEKIYNVARKRNDFDTICAHMVSGREEVWPFDLLRLEALKYTKRGQFSRYSNAAYQSALTRNLLDLICSHMSPSEKEAWEIEELKGEALKYPTRTEFAKGNCGAYNTSLKRKDYSSICSHMKYSTRMSAPEKELFSIIKDFYATAKTLKDMEVKIEGRGYIHGFDIDIYIPELKKGIEFDGTWSHSVEGLKRGRPNWPDSDLPFYHQLKDEWFASKGILILHIKEEEWNLDKEACIKRCLDFLKS